MKQLNSMKQSNRFYQKLLLSLLSSALFILPGLCLADEPDDITPEATEDDTEDDTEADTSVDSTNDKITQDPVKSLEESQIPAQASPAPEDSSIDEEPFASVFEGIVLDPLGNPIAHAQINFTEQQLIITSNEDGTFQVDLGEGVYKIVVSAQGLAQHEETIVLDETALLSGFEIFMEFPMGDVVVTGTKSEKLASTAPVRTQVINRKVIERRQATNVAESLDSTSGVRVENNCQNCGFFQVRLNGLDGRYSQILIDGNPVISSLAGVYGLEQIPTEMIERIEIVKGGGSALYGGNAVAGVVNIITARPTRNFANAMIKTSLIEMKRPEFRIGTDAGMVNDSGNMAVHVFGGATARQAWDANNDGFSEIGRTRQVMTGAQSYIDIGDQAELQIKYHVLQERRRGGDSLNTPEHDVAVAESTDTRRYGGEIRFKQLVGSEFNYELGYGLAYTERDSYYGGGGDVELSNPPTLEEWEEKQAALNAYGITRNPMHTADATANFLINALGQQIVTTGGQFVSDSLSDQFPGYGRQIDEHYWNIGGILQHNWIPNEKVETIIGMRADRHSELDNAIVSPRASFMLKPTNWFNSRTSIATGFRAPQVFDEDLHITMVEGAGQIVYNDPDLLPERSISLATQLEFDYEVNRYLNLTFGINGFWTRIKNAFDVELDDDPSTIGEIEMLRTNRGTTQVLGLELESGLTFSDVFGASTGWTFERSRNSEEDPDFGTNRIFRTPSVYGYFEVWTRVKNALEISTTLDITGSMKVPHYAGYIAEDTLEDSPWFADWNINLSYRIDTNKDRYLTPFIGIRNILDSRQTDYDIGPERDAGYIYGPRLPRTLFLGIRGGI